MIQNPYLPLVTEPAFNTGTAGRVTVAVKLWVSLMMGNKLSETTTATVCVEGACAMVGLQENTPLLALMAALVGAVSKLKVKVWAGMSASVAELVTSSILPAMMVWSEIAASTGG